VAGPDRSHYGARDDRADTWNRHQALTALIQLRQRLDLRRYSRNAFIEPAPVLGQIGDKPNHPWGQLLCVRSQDVG
jgi:hypothetical protein